MRIEQIEAQLNSKNYCFKKLVDDTIFLIKKHISTKSYLSWSGGKDSTVVLHLLIKQYPQIPVLHIKSGYELPDGYDYMLRISKEWNLNFFEIKTPIDYLELCEEFGLPHLRPKNIQNKVISLIKKNPANEWTVSNGFDQMFWGIRADESKSRKALSQYKGFKFIDKNGIKRISPILNWKVEDILAYYEYENIELNPIYLKENCGISRKTIRNTGWLSTDGENRGRIEWLRKNYPEYFQKIRSLL